ncbi:hypothetical protein GCM10009869_05300 [Amnibacterium kyonggiense]
MRETTPQDAPTADASRAAIEDLMSIWPDRPLVTVTAKEDAYLRSTAIWVFAEHAVRTAKAVLVLDEQKMYMQCAPLARLVYECGMTAAWMGQTPYSGHSLFKAAKKQHDLLIGDLARMANVPVPKDDEDAMTGLGDAEQLPKFWARAKVLDGGKWIHPYYRLLSAASHGDGSLVEEYLEEVDEEHAWGHRHQFRDPEQFRWRHVVLALTVVALNFALWTWDEVSVDHELRDDLERVGKKHHLGSRPVFDHDDPAKTAEPGA